MDQLEDSELYHREEGNSECNEGFVINVECKQDSDGDQESVGGEESNQKRVDDVEDDQEEGGDVECDQEEVNDSDDINLSWNEVTQDVVDDDTHNHSNV